MDVLRLATEFVEGSCAGQVGRIGELLAEDFRLQGPLGDWPKPGYLAALLTDRPAPGQARVLSAVAAGAEVTVVYECRHEQALRVVAQTFRFRDGLIVHSRVVNGGDEPA